MALITFPSHRIVCTWSLHLTQAWVYFPPFGFSWASDCTVEVTLGFTKGYSVEIVTFGALSHHGLNQLAAVLQGATSRHAGSPPSPQELPAQTPWDLRGNKPSDNSRSWPQRLPRGGPRFMGQKKVIRMPFNPNSWPSEPISIKNSFRLLSFAVIYYSEIVTGGFPGDSMVKSPPCNARLGNLVWEGLTCQGTTKPVAMTTELVCCNSWSPYTLESMLCSKKKPLQWEAYALQQRELLLTATREKPTQQQRPNQNK